MNEIHSDGDKKLTVKVTKAQENAQADMLEKQAQELQEKLRIAYADAIDGMTSRIEVSLKEFAADDAKWQADVAAGKKDAKAYKTWRKDQALHNDRLKALKKALTQDLTAADKMAMAYVNQVPADVYAEGMNFATYEIEHGAKANTSFTLYNKNTVMELVANEPNLLPQAAFDKAKDTAWNSRHVTSAVTQAVLQGQTVPQLATSIAGIAAMDQRAAVKAARTAITSAHSLGKLKGYERAAGMGIDVKKQWLAALDSRTRGSHRHLDGEVVELDAEFSNGLKYPGDPDGPASEVYNCRCTLVPVIGDVQYDDVERADKLGKMSYEEWKAGREVGARPPAVFERRTYHEAPGEDFVKSQGYSSWIGGLSDEERDAVEKYTSDMYARVNSYYRGTGDFAPDGKYGAALSDQVAVSYVRNNPLSRRDGESMPQYLRRKRGDEYASVRAAVSAADSANSIAGGLDSAIAGYTLPNDTVLFRRVSADALPDDLEGLIGSTYRDDGFMSTSIFNNNNNFVGESEYLMHISVPSGTGRGMYVNDLSTSRDEYEFILARGSEFTITGVSVDEGITHIFMEMII